MPDKNYDFKIPEEATIDDLLIADSLQSMIDEFCAQKLEGVDGIMILFRNKDGSSGHWSRELYIPEALYLIELTKMYMLSGYGAEEEEEEGEDA